MIKHYIIPLIFFCITILSSIKSQTSSRIIVLDSSNYDEVISNNDYIFILYHKKNTKRSEEVLAEFSNCSKNKSNKKIIFGIVEKDESPHIVKNLGYKIFPRLIIFFKGYPIEYDNGYLEENINIFLSIKQNQNSEEFKTFAEIQDFRKIKETVIYIGDSSPDDIKFQTFLKITKKFDDVIFGHCSTKDCMENFDNFSGIVIAYNGYTNESFNLDNFSVLQLFLFVNERTTRNYPKLTDEATSIIFNGYSAGLFLFLDGTKEDQKKYIYPLYKASRNLKKAIHIVVAEINSELGSQISDIIKLELKDVPKVFIIDSRKEEIHLYRLDKEINEENIFDFSVNWGLNKLTPLFYSEEPPENQSYPIYTLVGKNYKEIVVDSEDDILVYYFSPKCEHCKKFEKVYRRLINIIVKDHGDVMTFAKINGDANDIVDVNILGYPAVNLYLKGKKSEPIKYEMNDFDINKLAEFIMKNMNHRFKIEVINEEMDIVAEKVDNEENVNSYKDEI